MQFAANPPRTACHCLRQSQHLLSRLSASCYRSHRRQEPEEDTSDITSQVTLFRYPTPPNDALRHPAFAGETGRGPSPFSSGASRRRAPAAGHGLVLSSQAVGRRLDGGLLSVAEVAACIFQSEKWEGTRSKYRHAVCSQTWRWFLVWMLFCVAFTSSVKCLAVGQLAATTARPGRW